MLLADLINDGLRLKGNKTRYWLANVTGVSIAALYDVTNGKRKSLTLPAMVKVAIALDLDLNELKKIDWED
ncbi:helix-turn-helix domain-containing protein [Weissella cibaria]|uniref:helix-turn-helix domain-containing protein n=1 Tax=Weissella cibaria TaxID=137591 RepID=UPI0011937B39|nr:helix-turn-helix transcriptional regulator [Weissella cibaria]TVV37849.1 helix-turn-helix transcriptional regulator [Weissella cibaria]